MIYIADINKENDVNIQNLSDNISPTLIDSNQIIFQNENNSFINKASSVSIIFYKELIKMINWLND